MIPFSKAPSVRMGREPRMRGDDPLQNLQLVRELS